MASKPPFLTLHPHDEELRDPTREELYNGPKREKLPTAIQQMTEDETACTFCGVSYFVFSEVQELQATVKRYKKTFHDFVRFMERERQTSQALKAQVLALKKSFEDATSQFSVHANKLAQESLQLRLNDSQLTSQLKSTQRDAELKHAELLQLQAQCKRDEDEWKLASALTDQKLRNEILHLSSQLEKCKLQSASQETEYYADLARERAKIKELELLVASTRASLSSAERQVVTERDVLKQQLLAANERVETEKETAKQLESQLRAVQQELQRVVSSKDSERSTFTQIQNEIGSLKQQLLQHEKAKAALVSERAELRDQVDKSNDLMKSFRIQITTLEKQMGESATNAERCKLDYARELEKMRLEHGQAINRMQRDHLKAVEELKEQQKAYVEYLQKQSSDAVAMRASALQYALVEMETKLLDAEKHATQWKLQASQRSDELQSLKLTQQQTTTRLQVLERELTELQGEKKELVDETEHLQRQLEKQKAQLKRQLEQAQHDEKTRMQQQIDDQQTQFQRKIDSLQGKCDQMRRENEQLRAAQAAKIARDPEDDAENDDSTRRKPQQAWGDGSSNDSKQSSAPRTQKTRANNGSNQEHHELEKLVDSLRHSLEQKDKEIFLLQQTVHRECLERTSLLEKMRSGKVLPDVPTSSSSIEASMRRSSTITPRKEQPPMNSTDADESEDRDEGDQDPSQPKASFYERLRRAGQRKAKPRKS